MQSWTLPAGLAGLLLVIAFTLLTASPTVLSQTESARAKPADDLLGRYLLCRYILLHTVDGGRCGAGALLNRSRQPAAAVTILHDLEGKANARRVHTRRWISPGTWTSGAVARNLSVTYVARP